MEIVVLRGLTFSDSKQIYGISRNIFYGTEH